MSKRIALKDSVEVDGAPLSNFARDVRVTSEHERVDVSGFNPTGSNETLAGSTTQSVTVEFYGSYGTGEVHETLYHVHAGREIVTFAWRPDQTAPASATNPELRGNVQVLSYGPGATRGDADTFSVEFTAADEDGLMFFETPAVP
jgi:hypothetical protein